MLFDRSHISSTNPIKVGKTDFRAYDSGQDDKA